MAADALGLDPLGFEWDDAACATRAAAGFRTVQADVAELDPGTSVPGGCEVLIASPPCQAFSAAGKGGGHRDLPIIWDVLRALLDGRDVRAEAVGGMEDPRSLLVVEPLRWILELRPAVVACEQVPPVLPIWEWMRDALRTRGYSTWCGLLSSEQYGVPQTRSRAILMATLSGRAAPPAPTHRRYVPMPKEPIQDSLFDAGPRERIVAAGDELLEPWVSMAEALGWGMIARPTTTLTAGGGRQGGPDPLDGGSGARATMRREREAGRFAVKTRGEEGSRDGDVFDGGESPSRVVTGKTYSWLVEQEDVALRSSNQEKAAVRGADEPASTVLFGHRANEVAWVRRERSGDRSEEGFDPGESPAQALTSKARSWSVRTGSNSMSSSRDAEDMVPYERSVDDPAPTVDTQVGRKWKVAAEGDHVDPPHGWKVDRPATTLQCDDRVSAPGHKGDRRFEPDFVPQMEGAVRITVEEASILQGFPPGYPWQGSRTKRFEQIGNAIPPPLARAVLAALLEDL